MSDENLCCYHLVFTAACDESTADDDTRVILKHKDDDPSDSNYINANYLDVSFNCLKF